MSSSKAIEVWLWLAVSEDRLLLHDGLARVADLVPVPSGVAELGEEDCDLPVLDGKTPAELATIIRKECSTKNTAYASLIEYRRNALVGLWQALKDLEAKRASNAAHEMSSPSQSSSTQTGSFSSRISLVLIFPMLKSLSKVDPGLSSETAHILLESLRACEPLSLSSEPPDCISGLESMLQSWLKSAKEESGEIVLVQNAASALVALGVAVGTGSLLLRTVHMLQSLEDKYPDLSLLVPGILDKLLLERESQEESVTLTADVHFLCWGYDDGLVQTEKEGKGPRSIAFNGQFVYVTSSSLKYLLKMGTGKRGTIRGFVYASVEVGAGWVVHVDGQLLLLERREEGDKEEAIVCTLLDSNTLERCGNVAMSPPPEPLRTLHLLSDGTFVYWLYVLKANESISHPINSEKVKQHPVFMQALRLEKPVDPEQPDSSPGEPRLLPHKERVYIHRTVADMDKNSDVMKALLRSNPSYATGNSSMLASLMGQVKDDSSPLTSMGLSIRTLERSAAYTTGSSLVVLAAPPTSGGGRGGLFGVQGHSSKALCYNFCYSVHSGKLVSQVDLQSTSQLHCAITRGASVENMAACYDSRNLCVWTTNDDWIDVWDCAGKVKVSSHHLDARLGKMTVKPTEDQSSTPDTLHVSKAISVLLRHIGVESCRLVPGLEFSTLVVHSLPLSFLSQCCDLLEKGVGGEQWENVQAVIVTLQAVLPAFFSSSSVKEERLSSLKERIRSLVWSLLMNRDCPSPLLTEVQRIISRNAEILFVDDMESPAFITSLLEAGSDSPELVSLRHELLINIASNMQIVFGLFPAHLSITQLVKGSLLTDSLSSLRQCFQLSEEELPAFTATCPVMTPSLHCASMLMSLCLRGVTFALFKEADKKESHDTEDKTSEEKDKTNVQSARAALLGLCDELNLFTTCEQTLQELVKLASTLPTPCNKDNTPSEAQPTSEEATPTHARLSAIERVAKSSVLGCVLQPLLVMINDSSVCTLQMANTLQRQLSSLAQLTAQVCGLLYGAESLEVRVPSPWAMGRTIETIHPVRDNYKFKETVTFPGAKNLYLKFDGRCASQYDYDKVAVYAGDNTSCPKVAEYGGNTHGFGSRSVLGKGWPKDLIKVEGDSVVLTFEMKSGREHSTPDKAMWGFAVTIRPQESADDAASGLPFITDLYLSLITVCCSLIGRLYSGPHPTEDERRCKQLMQYELLQRCVWPVDQGSPNNLPLDATAFPFFSPSPREPLPPVVISKLRGVGSKPRPPLRPSHQDLIRPDSLEEVIVSVCLKQYGLPSPLELLGQESGLTAHSSLLEAIFSRINGLERRLQTLAELESNWWHDVEDLCGNDGTNTEAFFFSLLQNESSLKNFELLCVLKKVEVNQGDILSTAKQLQDLLELDVEKRRSGSGQALDYTPVTRTIVKGVQERAELLLNVTIEHGPTPSADKERGVVKEDLLSPGSVYSRSISAPPSTIDVTIRRQRSWGVKSANKLDLLDLATSLDQSNLLDQIFQFIGSKPEEAVSCDSFLSAASQHWRRGVCRVRALGHLQQLLTSDYMGLAVNQLLASVGVVLQKGPGVADIACGGMGERVREVFGSVMQAVVELASKQPASCINTIAMLCIVPYTRLEEGCLVRSGLVKLLDHLCSLIDTKKPLEVGGAADESLHRVTSLSWASFQVLAEQCVSWESQSSSPLSSGLAQQVSHLLTNHLSRAMDRLVVSEGGASESLQDALSLLLGLAKSHMGKAILSQPACVSKLLLLLTDQRPSPKLVLIALQLCRIALPLMSIADCSQVEVPPHLLLPDLTPEEGRTGSGIAAKIVGLFLSKLAEYIVPDSSQVSNKQTTTDDGQPSSAEPENGHTPSPTHKDDDFEQESGQASVYVYKRENENAADILQPLISQDPRQFRLAGGNRMQEVMAMDRALTQHGIAEVITDSYRGCVRRALRWANMGFTVSVGPPSQGSDEVSGSGVDKKKARSEAAARKKNIELLKTDPPRPFVSGHVANSLASEVIGLLNGLITEPGAAQVWGKAIKDSMLKSLISVPVLSPKLAAYTQSVSDTVSKGGIPSSPGDLLSSACIANATFAAVGGFKESIRPGLKVQVVGEGLEGSYGTIQSISERRGLANVQFEDDELCFGPNKTLEVPITRLLPPHKETLPLKQLGVQNELCKAIVSLLDNSTPSPTHASTNADANTSSLGLCRLFAEMRTRACVALSHHMQDASFAQQFLKQSQEVSSCLSKLTEQAKGSSPGMRVSLVEQHCQGLRMLYRDCSRPAAPRVERIRREPKRFKLDVTRVWPPVTSCSFTHQLTCLTYQGPSGFTPHTPSALSGGEAPASGQPKGVVIYTNMPIPAQAPSFYWELELSHIGDSSADTANVAMGYSPPPGAGGGEQWSYPVGSCFIRSSGRGCQVTGDNSMEWNTFRLDAPLKNGDVVGCGWVQGEEETTGTVYFTLNGEQQGSEFKETPPTMYPFLHVQKKAIRVRINLGERPFLYTQGTAHREAANIQEEGESAEAVMADFGALPFAMVSDSEEEGEKEGVDGGSSGSVVELAHTGPPTRKLKPPIATVGYDYEASQGYQPSSSFDTMLESGPLVRPGGGVAESEDVEEDEGHSAGQEEDLHALLVKAWETKVFPVIQRRFRNDQERKSGLEQIKGALQLGMESIAQETVEFLYEENGGIPKDLKLPTMDDVKADLGKFTISRIRKGSAVVVQREFPYSRCGVRAMQKTQGLTGIVLDVDQSNEVIQVECYLQNEGALVRFWYPVVYLERPPPGYRKSAALRGADAANMLVHRELIHCERSLASLYCRTALLRVKQELENSREAAIDHLSLVNAECFAEPLSNGLSTTTSPDLATSTTSTLHTLTLSPLHTFYSDVERMCTELQQAIKVTSGDLVPLAQDLCDCLQRTPQSFSSSEVKVTESKEAFDVTYPDAAFMIVSCVDDRSVSSRPSSNTYKYPWARILCYRGGQGKGGSQQMQEVARYPNEIVQSSSNQYCGPTYPALILPFSRIHIKLGGFSTRPGKMLNILALPAGFPLALSFADTLSKHCLEVFKQNGHSEQLVECVKALSVCLESLCKVVSRLSCPQLLKILLLHQMADLLWTLCHIYRDSTTEKPQMYAFPSEFLQSIRQELVKIFETETSKFPGKNKQSLFPPPSSVGAGGSGKYSTYFQAVLEFVLAAAKYQEQFHNVKLFPAVPPSTSTLTVPPPVARSTSSEASPSGAPSAAAPPPSVAELTKKPPKKARSRKLSKKETQGEASSKKKDDWLCLAHSAATLLQSIVLEQPQCPVSQDASLSCQSKSKPSSRLIIVTGIDQRLNIDDVQTGVRKVCNTYGGLYRDALYLPTEPASKESTDNKDEKGESEGTPVDVEESAPEVEAGEQLAGCAVLELCCATQVSAASTALLTSPTLKYDDSSVKVSTVSESMKCGEDKIANDILVAYLREKLVQNDSLSEPAKQMLTEIFKSSLADDPAISTSQVSNGLQLFLNGLASVNGEAPADLVAKVWKSHGNEEGLLSVDGFLTWVCDHVKLVTCEGVRGVWLGLLASGYDLYFERCSFFPFDQFTCHLTTEQDHALIYHIDSLCRSLATTSSSIEPWDLTLSDAHVTSQKLASLQGLSTKDLRMRLLQLKHINSQLAPLFAAVDLRCNHPLSLSYLLSKTTPLLFYDRKISIFHSVLNASTRRSFDQAPPEIKMDPLESVSGMATSPLATHYCQAAQQLLSVPSAQLCIPLASGGDPTYAFNVKLSGEEVQGTSGSFRHFLWQVVRELQSSVLPILLPCPSGSTGLNHGRYILATGPMTFPEEKLLQFFGQLLGVAIRADMPIALDLLPCFWKSLKGEPLSLSDVKEADCVTYNLTTRLLECGSPEEFEELVTGLHHGRGAVDEGEEFQKTTPSHSAGLRFVFSGLDGSDVELCHKGAEKRVEYLNREEFVLALRDLRMRELACKERMDAVRCGLASVIPLELLVLLTAEDLDLRVCGLPDVDLEYLKRHTMYQVGLMETDKHVQYFWHALESFSQDELRKFIKFACNQERIPFGHPCREGGRDKILHVPPYPMKIAPPDGQGPPDNRYIRAETCMFMIKLPQYSSQEIMTERLRYAIHCREDPLSG